MLNNFQMEYDMVIRKQHILNVQNVLDKKYFHDILTNYKKVRLNLKSCLDRFLLTSLKMWCKNIEDQKFKALKAHLSSSYEGHWGALRALIGVVCCSHTTSHTHKLHQLTNYIDVKNVTYRVKSAFTKKHFLTTWPLGGSKKIVPHEI